MLDTLVFSGGGIGGISFIGCIKFLHEKKMLSNIKKFIGTSSGAIIAALLSVGYTYEELYQLSTQINLHLFKDINPESVLSFFEDFGIDTGKNVEKIIEIFIKFKTKKNLFTFSDLKELNKELIVSGVCINNQKICYFNYENYPNMPISEAIRISTSVPILFKPYIIDDNLYIDGGLLDNFPIHLANNSQDNQLSNKINETNLYLSELKNTVKNFLQQDTSPTVDSEQIDNFNSCIDNLSNAIDALNLKKKNKNVLGFSISTAHNRTKISTIDSYIRSMICSTVSEIESIRNREYKENTVEVKIRSFAFDFDISPEIKNELIQDGYNSTKLFFENSTIFS
tara:strand:+ start:1478 stop:2497 length:1020 start_codon:yes stop_codon:yes gene_type:complete